MHAATDGLDIAYSGKDSPRNVEDNGVKPLAVVNISYKAFADELPYLRNPLGPHGLRLDLIPPFEDVPGFM